MVVKKTVKKTSPVIVETKKHEEVACCNNKGKRCFGILVILLLLLNLAIGILNYLDGPAWKIEALKVGGRENLELVKELYKMDTYKEQQKGAIMQVLNSFAGAQQQAIPTQEMPQQMPTDVQALPQ